MEEEIAVVGLEIQKLLQRYLEGLPIRELSRCPFSGEVFSLVIDDLGLDGLWWNYEAPKRPETEKPRTWFAMDGAMKLGGEPGKVPFLSCPGPDVPFVIPRLLEFIQVKAVISTMKVGEHKAYPVVYYADPMLYGEKRVNDWGTRRYWESGSILPEHVTAGQYVSLVTDSGEFDFDLEPWIRAGKLLWIEEGDETLRLRSTLGDCPYLNLPGSHRLKFIRNGVVWEEPEELETFEEGDSDFDLEHFQRILLEIEEGEK